MNERRIFLENFPSEALYQNAKGLLALAYQLKYKKHKSEFVNVSTDSIIITLDCKYIGTLSESSQPVGF